MRRNLLVAVCVGTGLSLSWWGVSAAQNPAARATVAAGAEARVALVDIAYVFKNYNKFNRLYNEMKEEVKKREKEIADKQTELKALMAKKQQFTPDSTNSKQIDHQIVQIKTELDLLATNSRQEFTQKEANLYHQTYQEVETVIRRIAEGNGITLVLRASRDEEPTSVNPQDVIKEVSQQVIYALPQMDITAIVLDALNAGKPAVNPNIGNKQPGPVPQTGTQRNNSRPSGTMKK